MERNSFDKQFVVLEGNIGAGKSTMLNVMEKKLGLSIIDEPMSKWQNVGQSDNILDLFYKDTKRWAYTFQSYAFLTRVHAILEHMATAQSGIVHVLERSVYCDRFCFAKNCYESELMTPLEWHIYKEWFLWLVQNFTPRPSGFIYLRTDPDISHQRISKRCRPEEMGIQLMYLQSLHQKHEDWLIHQKDVFDFLKDIPVLVLDCNQEFENNHAELDKHLVAISSFIDQIQNKPKEQFILPQTPATPGILWPDEGNN